MIGYQGAFFYFLRDLLHYFDTHDFVSFLDLNFADFRKWNNLAKKRAGKYTPERELEGDENCSYFKYRVRFGNKDCEIYSFRNMFGDQSQMLIDISLEKVYLLPNIAPSHKPDITPFPLRYQMVKQVISDEKKLALLPISAMLCFTRNNLSGEYHTKRLDKAIEIIVPGAEYYHIMGADSFDRLDNPGIILDLDDHHLVVVNRPRFALPREKIETCLLMNNFHFLRGQDLEVSSSAIRRTFNSGRVPRGKLPRQIIPYILEHNLYTNR